MLPRISLGKVADDTSASMTESVNRLKGSSLPLMPIIPPRVTVPVTSLPAGSGDTSWYVVLSPRESRGLSGPFSIHQLKQMYKSRDITDRTLVWKEGEESWQQLVNQSLLRSRLISIPIVPPRLGSYNAELAVFDPVVEMPQNEILEQAVPIHNITFDRTCAVCGGMAVAQIPGYGEQQYDLFKGRHEVGTNDSASEILPGFLWVGSSASSKHKFLLMVGVTLLINCTDNMNNPLPQPPYFRCIDIPMIEKPGDSFTEKESKKLLDSFERIYDTIENERLNPEKNVLSDPTAPYHRGAIDEFGFPIKGADDKPFRRPGESATTPYFPPRVLVWSRLGTDRAVVIAIAYLIKQYGVSLRKAVKIMKKNRPTSDISKPYVAVLEEWSKKYTLGMLLCIDCKFIPFRESSSFVGDKNSVLIQLRDTLKQHLPRIIVVERDRSLANDVDSIVIGLRENYFTDSPWAKLIDINLSDRRLSDSTISSLFKLLGASNCLENIQSLNLSNNEISFLALKEMLSVFYPYLLDPDNVSYSDYVDEEQDQRSMTSYAKSLTSLDLSLNRIEQQGAKYLSLFLKMSEMLVWVSLYGNNMPDDGISEVLHSLTTPMFDFQSIHTAGNRDSFLIGNKNDEDDEWHSHSSQTIDSIHNRSITHLDLGGNQFGESSAEALSQMLRQNVVLHSLKIEHCSTFSSMYFKDVTNAIRLYNGTLSHLYLSGISMSVGAAKHLARIHESLDTRIMKLVLSNCGLFHLQIKAMVNGLSNSNYLSHLDISNNSIGLEGTDALVAIVKGSINKRTHTRVPPLKHLDVTNCHLEPEGCTALMEAIAEREELSFVDLSYNMIGPSNVAFVDAFGRSNLHCGLINYCSMQTSTVCKLFDVLCNGELKSEVHGANKQEKRSTVSCTLRSISLAGNNVSDSAAENLIKMMQTNTCLEHIDLGYNNFTNRAMEYFKLGIKITSSSTDAQKATELNINLIGNKCEPYALDTPGLSRSKVTFRFGVVPDKDKMDLAGYSHISDRARGKFIASKMLDDQFRAQFPQQDISTLY